MWVQALCGQGVLDQGKRCAVNTDGGGSESVGGGVVIDNCDASDVFFLLSRVEALGSDLAWLVPS